MSFDTPRRSRFPLVLWGFALLLFALAAGIWQLKPRFERQAPEVRLSVDTDVLGRAPIEVVVSDAGTGLKSLQATLSAGGAELPLASEQFGQPAQEMKFTIDTAKLSGIKEGPAVLRVRAVDASLFRGNEAVLEKNLTIDVTPPALNLLADDRYVNFGGVGAIAYSTSADAVTSGVRVGERFFPGFEGVVAGRPEQRFALFAHPYDAKPDERAVLVATDKAGNTREMRLVYELKDVRYRKSTIRLDERFLQQKVAPLVTDVATRQGSPRDVFIAVNQELRRQNDERIREITSKTTPKILWSGAFRQLSNSKVEANFADLRTYTWEGEAINTAYHLGYDLSVTRHYPVEAANSGNVAFTGDLGIYGNTVILDHGLGLYTLYSHLSAIDVKAGDAINQGQVLGRTGETGLAAGDHLHYGVYLHGVAVLPVEWWDAKWIRDNVAPKLNAEAPPAAAQANAPASPRRSGRRR